MNSVATDRVTAALVELLWRLQVVEVKHASRWDKGIVQPKHGLILHHYTMFGGSRWYVD